MQARANLRAMLIADAGGRGKGTAKELAVRYGMSERTVYRMLKLGESAKIVPAPG